MKMVSKLYKRLVGGKWLVDSSESLAMSRLALLKAIGYRLSAFAVCRLFLLSTIGLWLSAFAIHPYYMSVTEFEYKPAEKEVQVACKIFTDDLEAALRLSLQKKVDLLNISANKENEQLLNSYLQEHLKLQLDGKAVPMQMIGFEHEGEAVWIYFVTKNTARFKTVTVFNDILYSYKEEQINIIHFKNGTERKSHRLNYPTKQVTLSW